MLIELNKIKLINAVLYHVVGIIAICTVSCLYCLFLSKERIDEFESTHKAFSENLFMPLENDLSILEKGLSELSKKNSCNMLESLRWKPYNLTIIQNYKVYCDKDIMNKVPPPYEDANDITFESKLMQDIHKISYKILIKVDMAHIKNKLDSLIKIVPGYEYKWIKGNYKLPENSFTSKIKLTGDQSIAFGYDFNHIKKIKTHYTLLTTAFAIIIVTIYSGFSLIFTRRTIEHKTKLIRLKLSDLKRKYCSIKKNNELIHSKHVKLRKYYETIKKFQIEMHSKIKEELKIINKLFISFQETGTAVFIEHARKRIQRIQGLTFHDETNYIINFSFIDELKNIVPAYLQYYQQDDYSSQEARLGINTVTLKQILFSILQLICFNQKPGNKLSFHLDINELDILFVFKSSEKIHFNDETNYYNYNTEEGNNEAYFLSLEEVQELLLLHKGQITISNGHEDNEVAISLRKYIKYNNNIKTDTKNVH